MSGVFLFEGIVCGFVSTVVAGYVMYKTSGHSFHSLPQATGEDASDVKVTKSSDKEWYRLAKDGEWVRLSPELEAAVNDAYDEGIDAEEYGKYTIHLNSERGSWKYWLENTDKETFTKLKHESA